jgi:hypothetical protein
MPQAAPGGLVCTNSQCAVAGLPTTRATCVSCKQSTKSMSEVGPQVSAVNPVRTGGSDGGEKIMDMTSRAIFGGFWIVVTLVALIGGIALLVNGVIGGLLLLGAGVLTGLYARYIFRGGRFRILFW